MDTRYWCFVIEEEVNKFREEACELSDLQMFWHLDKCEKNAIIILVTEWLGFLFFYIPHE